MEVMAVSVVQDAAGSRAARIAGNASVAMSGTPSTLAEFAQAV
jgi:hypothetical protein